MKKGKYIVSGFTLIELILYVGLVAVFLTGAIYFSWDVIYGREKAFQNQVVEQSANIALSRIGYEIQKAKNVVSTGQSQIVLSDDIQQTTIDANPVSGCLQIIQNGMGPYCLTSNQVRVVNTDIFENLSDLENDTKNINVKLTLEQASGGVPGQPKASTTVESSYELKGNFNEARSLLMNLTGAFYVTPNVQGITLENSNVSDILIDKIYISWSGTTGGERITGIQIGGGVTEWNGSQFSGATIDINDYLLPAGGGVVDVNYLSFDSNMTSVMINLTFIMSDGSGAKGQFIVGAGSVVATPTPTGSSSPTPIQTPTPTPAASPFPTSTPPVYTTCQQYCAGSGFAYGICLKNAGACSSAGYTYLGGGDPFCTGGPNADTCCCYR